MHVGARQGVEEVDVEGDDAKDEDQEVGHYGCG